MILDRGTEETESYPALYFRNANPNRVDERNSNTYLLAGPWDVAQETQVVTDAAWKYRLELTDASRAFYEKPFSSVGLAGDEKLLGYWCPPFRLYEGGEEVVTYSIPLVDQRGRAVGVFGVEISLNYLYKYLPPSDLLAVDSISVKVRNRVKKRQVKNAVEAFNRWTNEQRDIIVGLGNSLEHAEITPVQALDELDRIAAESRARLTKLIGQALVADTSLSGRERYEHWESNRGGTVSASDVLYKGTYLSDGHRHEYNPASTIRLTANSAGVRLTGKAAERTGRFQSNNVSVWAYPTYLDRYVDYDPSSSSRANYLTSAANVGPRTSTR